MTLAATRRSVFPPAGVGRVLAAVRGDGRPVSLDEHLDVFGPLQADADLIAATEASGLRGRGGGGFPTGKKLRAVADARAARSSS